MAKARGGRARSVGNVARAGAVEISLSGTEMSVTGQWDTVSE